MIVWKNKTNPFYTFWNPLFPILFQCYVLSNPSDATTSIARSLNYQDMVQKISFAVNWKGTSRLTKTLLLIHFLQTEACNFTKINTAPWVFFTFLKLYKW